MKIIDQVVARLNATKDLPPSRGLLEYGPGKAIDKLPAIFVLPLALKAGVVQTTAPARARLEMRFGVLIAFEVLDSTTGTAKELASLADTLAAVRGALFGWSPSYKTGQIVYEGGRLLSIGDNVGWWQEIYNVSEQMRAENHG
ncbi:MAG: hypothetical protein AAF442_05420 [Pseudomonadota bacterium]